MPTYRSRTTLKDIALSVGVSVNAVSIVLNNTGSAGQVSQETRRKIVDVAKELGYQPNTAARSLVTRRSNTIGFYFNYELNIVEPFTSAMIYGASRACRERRQALILYGRRSADQTSDEISAELLSGIADGVVLASWTAPAILERLQTSYLPIVHYPSAHPIFPSVCVDSYTGPRLALQYLKDAGHRHMMYRTRLHMDAVGRGVAFERAAKELHVKLTTVEAADPQGNVADEERRLLSLKSSGRPTAVVCWNDEFAYRMLDYCDEAGLRVPVDVAVVGYDGAHTFPELKRRLTTVYVPWDEMAHKAVSLLVDIRDGVSVPQESAVHVHLRLGDTA